MWISYKVTNIALSSVTYECTYTRNIYIGWRTKCHTIECTHNTFLLLQNHLTSDTELILIGWKIVPNEEHVQCDHRFASQPLANEPLHSSQVFRKCAAQLHYVGPELCYIFWPPLEYFLFQESP